jgi:VanZ family protein
MATIVRETDSRGIRWALWTLCVTVWTVLLLTPHPVRAAHEVLPAEATWPVSKCLHVAAYAFLTVLSAWLGVRGDRRWLLLGFLSLHGMATEYFQTFVPERHGSWSDVGIDHIGIALGLALSWKWWRR